MISIIFFLLAFAIIAFLILGVTALKVLTGLVDGVVSFVKNLFGGNRRSAAYEATGGGFNARFSGRNTNDGAEGELFRPRTEEGIIRMRKFKSMSEMVDFEE